MKKLIILICLLATSLTSFATDKVGMSYNTKKELSGLAIKAYVVKLEYLTGSKVNGNVTDDLKETNLIIEPDFVFAKYSIFKLQVSPEVGVSLKNSIKTVYTPIAANPGHATYSENSSINFLTGAALGLVVEPKENLNLSIKAGMVNSGGGYREQVSFGVSFWF